MKTVLLLLVTLAVAAGPAQALQCHVCTSATNCKKPQVCPTSSRYCRTQTRVETLAGNLVEKECAEQCTPTHNTPNQVSSGVTSVLCCQGDLCNQNLLTSASARSLINGSALALALAVGLLSVLLAPSL